MPEQDPSQRRDNFDEVTLGYSPEEDEAHRLVAGWICADLGAGDGDHGQHTACGPSRRSRRGYRLRGPGAALEGRDRPFYRRHGQGGVHGSRTVVPIINTYPS